MNSNSYKASVAAAVAAAAILINLAHPNAKIRCKSKSKEVNAISKSTQLNSCPCEIVNLSVYVLQKGNNNLNVLTVSNREELKSREQVG